MKKLLLLSVAGLMGLNAYSQYARHTSSMYYNGKRAAIAHKPAKRAHGTLTGARITSAAFLTEDFGTGTYTSLPTGWTTGTLNAGTWKWTDLPSTSQYTMGSMMSGTSSNGWMIFDSDSIGAATGGTPAGWLQSPAYNCSAHPHVGIEFQDYFRKYEDTCFVWVSTSSSFTTYTQYAVGPNNMLGDGESTDNPTTVKLDISAAAGGQSSVYIRFVNFGPSLGAYSWMIDDLSLVDPDSVDISLSKASVMYFSGTNIGFYSSGAVPARFADTLFPVVYVANSGFTGIPSLPVTADIYNGTSGVYSASLNINATVNAFDSLADFTQATPRGYYTNVIGQYTVPFSSTSAADAAIFDNYDTVAYAITDSTWSENAPGKAIMGQTYIYMPGSSSLAQSPATMFSIPAGQNDTLTSVSITFGASTKAGQVVGVQLYHYTDTSWVYDGSTEFRAITASDISSQGVFAVSGAGAPLVLQGGSGGMYYAAVLKGSSNTDTVTVQESENPAPESLMSGSSAGLYDTSSNDGAASQTFGNANLPSNLTYTPLIDLNFGINQDRSAVTNVTETATIGKPYPNPANTVVNIPFTLNAPADVKVTLSDIAGQPLKTQKLAAANGASKITFSTGDLPSGIYLYSLEINGTVYNARIVVAH